MPTLYNELADCGNVWTILPTALDALCRAGGTTEPEAAKRMPTVEGSIAVIPVYGVLTQRGGWFSISADAIGEAVTAAAGNPSVGAIVLDIDSPGGSVFGTSELAASVRAARQIKPVIAVANSMAASGAYWLASSATQMAVTPGGMVGSIGVVATHIDTSKLADQMGIKVTYVFAGKYKVEGNWDAPLDDEAKAENQRRVDSYYSDFVASVAEGRGVSAAKVERDFGQGRMFRAEQAVAAGMADRVATLRQVLDDLARNARGRHHRTAAELRMRIADA